MGLVDQIISENGIILEENIVRYNDTPKNSFKIDVNTTSGATGIGASYFKFYDNMNGIARILITEPHYTRDHSNKKGLHNIKLSNKQKRDLMMVLSSKPTKLSYSRFNTWFEVIAYTANIVAHVSIDTIEKYKEYPLDKCPQYVIPYHMPIPNYIEIS